jgi:hypothetical protein
MNGLVEVIRTLDNKIRVDDKMGVDNAIAFGKRKSVNVRTVVFMNISLLSCF